MSHFKRVPVSLLPILLVVGGVAAALTGSYLLCGLAATLLVGGVAAVAAGLLVDVD
jgi:hypothetical protein